MCILSGLAPTDPNEEDGMSDMLLELSKLAPPTSCPHSNSLSEEELSTEGEDSLTLLRRRLEEPLVTVQPPTPTVNEPAPLTMPTSAHVIPPTNRAVTTPLKSSPAGSGCSTPKYSPGRSSPVSKVL